MAEAPKVALITGSGKRRIGWHVAEALAGRGYALALHYHQSAKEALDSVAYFQGRGVEARAFQADLASEQGATGLVQQALSHFGRLDVLVNCAAIWHGKKLEETTAADVRSFFDTNTLGTFICSQQAGLAMIRQPEGGSIITVGDWATARPYVNYAAYMVSKGAIPALRAVWLWS